MTVLYAPVVTRMSNGLQLIAVDRPASNTFSAALTVRAGFNNDPAALPGLAHAVEHFSFVGENRQLAKLLTRNAAQVNAQTGPEVTAWFVSGHVDQLEAALKLLANVLKPAPFTAAELAAEKQILRHEYAAREEDPRAAALGAYYAKVVGMADLTSNRRIRRRLTAITANSITEFQQKYVRPANARLAIVGPTNSTSLASEILIKVPRDNLDGSACVFEPTATRKPERVTKIFADRFRHVWLISSHVVPSTSPQMRLVAELLFHILGGGPHSDLYRGLRDEKSLAYDVGAWNSKQLVSTALICHTTVDHSSVLEALRLMLERQNEIAGRGLTEQELEKGRAWLRRYREMSLDHPRGLSGSLAFEALRAPQDQFLGAREFIDTLMNLSLEDANRCAKELLASENRSVFVGGMLLMPGRWRARRLIRALNGD